MLETIREYALERLGVSGEQAALRQAHADYYLALMEQAAPELRGPHTVAWLDRLEAEHDNLRAALGWALEQGEAGIALRLAETVAWFWSLRGYLDEGRRWMTRRWPCRAPRGTAICAPARSTGRACWPTARAIRRARTPYWRRRRVSSVRWTTRGAWAIRWLCLECWRSTAATRQTPARYWRRACACSARQKTAGG